MNDISRSNPLADSTHIVVGKKEGITQFNKGPLDVLMQLPLPGIVIFVHGVNSDGEWFEQAEQGLCQGLNERLKRCDEHLAYTGTEAGQLRPAEYIPELTADGFINPHMLASNFIRSDDTFSPVIRFRFGYKPSGEELQKFGDGIFLNERDYWGGGPFANGCTSLPDLWGDGLEEELFLWVHVQHMNPTPERQVYACPPRPYYVLAAYRLARLVEAIRRKQADVPITIVCHSQGNLVGMAAAFLGDRLAPVTDAAGRTGRCVADSYVLCNAPYSLLDTNATDNWAERHMADPEGRRGRQTFAARAGTLAAFFDIVRQRRPLHQDACRIDRRMANPKHGFTAESDRAAYGLDGSTHGRVTLYCNPHDQVISATTVQGIGWRGMSAAEIEATNGRDVFCQRVFAQGFPVGQAPAAGRPAAYDYWANHYRQPLRRGSQDFWFPESPPARYSIAKGLDAEKNAVGSVLTVLTAPFLILALEAAKMRINALPPDDWIVPLQAPPLPDPFLPEAVRFGRASEHFDQDVDAPGAYRDQARPRAAGDPYRGVHREGERDDTPRGDENSEASLRYEQHAELRMQAKRAGRYKSDQKVIEEDQPETASVDYNAWRGERIRTMLVDGLDTHATDHSTILTNPMHARRALAYDVAIGHCDIPEEDLHNLRIAADWRFLDGLLSHDPLKEFIEYFGSGKFKGQVPREWTRGPGSEGAMPEKIVDERQGSWYLAAGGKF